MKNLKKIRTERGITLIKLSAETGISNQMLSNYELNKSNPPINTLILLADYFDVSLDNLCGRPRPYDLPTTTTDKQKELVKFILQLNELNTLKAISYCAGLLANQN